MVQKFRAPSVCFIALLAAVPPQLVEMRRLLVASQSERDLAASSAEFAVNFAVSGGIELGDVANPSQGDDLTCCCKRGIKEKDCKYAFVPNDGSKGFCCKLKEECPRWSWYYSLPPSTCPANTPIASSKPATNVPGSASKKKATPTGSLTYSVANHGTTFMQWSKGPVPEALAQFDVAPNSIPERKFNEPAKELRRDVGAIGTVGFRGAVASFVRMAAQNHGKTLRLGHAADVLVVLLGDDNKVTRILPGKAASLEGQQAVAVVSAQSSAFQLKQMSRRVLEENARQEKGAALFFRNF